MKEYTNDGLILEKGAEVLKNIKHKINSKSFIETEIIGIDDILSQVLWTNYFMKTQRWQTSETIVYQDNTSAIQLENNSKLNNNNRTKYINVKYFFHQGLCGEKETVY